MFEPPIILDDRLLPYDSKRGSRRNIFMPQSEIATNKPSHLHCINQKLHSKTCGHDLIYLCFVFLLLINPCTPKWLNIKLKKSSLGRLIMRTKWIERLQSHWLFPINKFNRNAPINILWNHFESRDFMCNNFYLKYKIWNMKYFVYFHSEKSVDSSFYWNCDGCIDVCFMEIAWKSASTNMWWHWEKKKFNMHI